MPNLPIKELIQRGISSDDIELAKATQAAQRRNGNYVQSIGVICGMAKSRKSKDPAQSKATSREKRDMHDRTAREYDAQALRETDPERALKAREIARRARELSRHICIEFDLLGAGNVSLGLKYIDAIEARLRDSGITPAQQHRASAVFLQIMRHMRWESYECSKKAFELAKVLRVAVADMSATLKLLEEVGAIKRVKRGRDKIITVTPEGAYRGNINKHGEVVEKYLLEVVESEKNK